MSDIIKIGLKFIEGYLMWFGLGFNNEMFGGCCWFKFFNILLG